MKIHIKKLIGMVSSLCFFFGSMLFLPVFSPYSTLGVWLFMAGSAIMFVDVVRA